jgi:pimeloyl-ACP methyl ester carboxylesterase
MPHAMIRGIRLYYELHGPQDAPPLVLNNGILMNAASSWRLQVPAFSSAHRVLLYDCRGQGDSDHPDTPCSIADHANDLAGLLDALSISAAHVLGISYGGEVAQAFTLAHPDRVRSLILADTVSEVGPELRLIVEGWRLAALTGDPDLFFAVTVPWNFSRGFMAAQAPVLDAARQRYRSLDFASVARLCEAFLGVDFTARLPAITAPTCVIVGEEDLIKGVRYARVIHGGDPVPVLFHGRTVRRDAVEHFDEVSAAAGGMGQIAGSDLMPVIRYLSRRAGFFTG